MEVKVYKKEYTYSYSLGAFPTIELLKNKKEYVEKILIHSSFNNEKVIKMIKELCADVTISTDDKLINKLSPKENCYIVGIFNKYAAELNYSSDHVLLDNPSNMGNFGTIIRSCLGFGIKNIAVIKPGLDIFDPKVIRASMGAIFSVNIAYFSSFEEYKEKYADHTVYSFMLQATKSLHETKFDKGRITLAFGNEATGLDKKYLSLNSVIIKHSDLIDSLNLTNAISIALYELYNSKN